MTYTVRISSYIGMDWDARHYYGRIQPGHIDMQHEVRQDDLNYRSFTYNGDSPEKLIKTSRFISKEQVIEAAKLWMKENAKEDDTLEICDTTETYDGDDDEI